MSATPEQLKILEQNPPPKATRHRLAGAALLCWGVLITLALTNPSVRKLPENIATEEARLEGAAASAAEGPGKEVGNPGPVAKTCKEDGDCGRTGRCIKGKCQATAMDKKKQAAAAPPSLHELMQSPSIRSDIVPPKWQDQSVHSFEDEDRRPGWLLSGGVFYPQER